MNRCSGHAEWVLAALLLLLPSCSRGGGGGVGLIAASVPVPLASGTPEIRTLIYNDKLNVQLEAQLSNGFGEINLFGFGNGGSGFGIYVLMSSHAEFSIRPKSDDGSFYGSGGPNKEDQLGDSVYVVNDLLAFDVRMTSLATGAVFASQVKLNFGGEGVGRVSEFTELDLTPSLLFTLAVVPVPTTGPPRIMRAYGPMTADTMSTSG